MIVRKHDGWLIVFVNTVALFLRFICPTMTPIILTVIQFGYLKTSICSGISKCHGRSCIMKSCNINLQPQTYAIHQEIRKPSSECHGHSTSGLIVWFCYFIFSYMFLNIWGLCKSLAVLSGLCGLKRHVA